MNQAMPRSGLSPEGWAGEPSMNRICHGVGYHSDSGEHYKDEATLAMFIENESRDEAQSMAC